MMVWSINLFVLAIGILIVGMIKPNWILFWMDKPKRVPIAIFSSFLFMVGATMFGQANIDKRKEAEKQAQQTSETKQDAIPTVAVEALNVTEKKETEKTVPVTEQEDNKIE